MSIITDGLPGFVVVRGQKCPIQTDFRVWLKFSRLISGELDEKKKLIEMFKLVFYELPPNMVDAVAEMMKFFSRSAGENNEKSNEKTTENKKAVFDFDFDADLIYAAFMQQYGIDLCEVKMHWWKFRALMNGLAEDTHFVKIVQYRSTDVSKIKDKEMKAFYQKMKKIYKLPDTRTEQEKEDDLNAAMAGMFGG